MLTRSDFDRLMVPIYAPAAFVPVAGEGSHLWDQTGKDYIDFASGIAVTSLGHAHPKLVRALIDQAQSLWHVSNALTNERALRLAHKLTDLTFADKVFFCNSGAEANEAALKLARRVAHDSGVADKHEIISFKGSFHGRTFFTVTVGGQPKYAEGFGPKPAGVTHLEFNDVEQLRSHISEQTCAVIVEPVQGEGGVVPATPAFLRAARELCDQHRALLIFDEVQSGVGRTGSLYAYMDYGVTPDILTSAKGLGGGFPIGAMMTTDHVAKHFTVGAHGTTYGGNPLACAVAEAVLDIVSTDACLQGVRYRSEMMMARLRQIADTFGCFSEIRGKGLLLGAQLAPAFRGRAKDFMTAAAAHGLLVLQAGPDVVRLVPSLVIPEQDIVDGLERLKAAVADVVNK